MLKAKKHGNIFLFILLAVLWCANTGVANASAANIPCAGGYFGYGATGTGESIALGLPGDWIQVTSLPHFQDNELWSLELTISNQWPTQETMSNGFFSLVFNYTPDGGNPDGSDDIFVQATGVVVVTSLSYDQSMDAVFQPIDPIPVDRWESLRCNLFYYGSLGIMDHIVLGKRFSPGIMIFNEEWDNGLTGDNPWQIDEPTPPYDQYGTSTTSVSNGQLTKDAARIYSDDNTGYYSNLHVDLTQGGTTPGLAIPSTSYLQFRISEMTSTTDDPATGSHVLMFRYRSGTRAIDVQYSASGPSMNIGYPPDVDAYVLYHPFQANTDVREYIHAAIENAQVEIPGTLYLKDITIMQQFYRRPAGPSPAHSMHLLMDTLRIVNASVN